MIYTILNRTIIRNRDVAGASPRPLDITEISDDATGEIVDTIRWNSALNRRLAREGRTRNDYIEQVVRELSA